MHPPFTAPEQPHVIAITSEHACYHCDRAAHVAPVKRQIEGRWQDREQQRERQDQAHNKGYLAGRKSMIPALKAAISDLTYVNGQYAIPSELIDRTLVMCYAALNDETPTDAIDAAPNDHGDRITSRGSGNGEARLDAALRKVTQPTMPPLVMVRAEHWQQMKDALERGDSDEVWRLIALVDARQTSKRRDGDV